jgi:hypothetical protein
MLSNLPPGVFGYMIEILRSKIAVSSTGTYVGGSLTTAGGASPPVSTNVKTPP